MVLGNRSSSTIDFDCQPLEFVNSYTIAVAVIVDHSFVAAIFVQASHSEQPSRSDALSRSQHLQVSVCEHGLLRR